MTVLELAEHGKARSVALDDATGRALANAKLVTVTRDPHVPNQWRVKAQGKVGVATITVPGGRTVTVRIVPKLPVRRLLFLLGYSLDAKGWRDDEDIELDEERELLPALARLFAQQTEKTLRQGLLQGYRTAEDTALLVRGRIREADQLRRQHGRLIPVEIVHDAYTPDIVENRLLRTACDRLLQLPGVSDQVRGRLLRLRVRLADITPIGRGDDSLGWWPSRLNTRYHHALRLAELVLRGDSVEHRPGSVTVSGFLLEMATVYQNFVTAALNQAFAGSPGRCRIEPSEYLDDRDAIRMRPDFVRYADDGTPLAVADAKYIAERPKGFPDANLYQMLAYCTALGLPEGHLIYAKGNATHTVHRVRHAGTTIHQHAIELDQPSAGLLAELRTLAGRM